MKVACDLWGSKKREEGGWGGKVWCSDPWPSGCSLTCQSQKAELPACVPIWGPSGTQAMGTDKTHTSRKRHTSIRTHWERGSAPSSREERKGPLCQSGACRLCLREITQHCMWVCWMSLCTWIILLFYLVSATSCFLIPYQIYDVSKQTKPPFKEKHRNKLSTVINK